jgi:hypothetical protein
MRCENSAREKAQAVRREGSVRPNECPSQMKKPIVNPSERECPATARAPASARHETQRLPAIERLVMSYRIERAARRIGTIAASLAALLMVLGLYGLLSKIWHGQSLLR